MGLQSELPPHREVIETPSGITIGLLKELSELPPHREVIETPLKILHIFNALKSEPPPHREVIETHMLHHLQVQNCAGLNHPLTER